MTEFELTYARQAQDSINEFSKISNNICFPENVFAQNIVEKFVLEHRTLQQTMIRTLYLMIRYLAEYHEKYPHSTDLRNEGGIEWIRKISKVEGHFPFI